MYEQVFAWIVCSLTLYFLTWWHPNASQLECT